MERLSECDLNDLRGRLVGEQYGGLMLVQRTLDLMYATVDNNRIPHYDINDIMSDLEGFCRPCLVCGYFVDVILLDADDICESCSRNVCTECGKLCCICDEDEVLYGFGDDDFEDENDFEDEMDDFEGDDWEEDEDDK